jgi:hypothetical protein
MFLRTVLASLFFATSLFAQEVLPVPQGKPIMLDGKLSPGEWADAKQFDAGGLVRIYLKQNNGDVLLAFEYLKGDQFTMDLYLSPADARLYDLHSSAKIGERTLSGSKWPEEWTWWNNDRWVANCSRLDSWDNHSFLHQKIREYQIARSRFSGTEWRAMLDVMYPVPQKQWKTERYPASVSDTETKGWLTLKLE